MDQQSDLTNTRHRVLILGGGTAGIITASLLRRAGQEGVAIVEPSTQHFYQPLWTLVGAGAVAREKTVRSEGDYIPQGVRWIHDRVAEVDPDRQSVRTESGATITYDFLVVAAGIQINWDAIPGLKQAIERGDASSNYRYDLAPRTWDLIRNFKGGTALFHMPGGPIKCPGAPQKIMYLAADHFRRKGILRNVKVIYGSATGSIYGAKDYAAVLNRVLERYGINTLFNHELVEVVPEKKEAIFRLKNGAEGERTTVPYDILHVVPPQSAPDFIRQSALADPGNPQGGWVNVNKLTLQHVNYPNVFALGDVANTPNAKTGAAVAHQAPVAAANLLAVLRGKEPVAQYDGYIACPIVTGYGRMLLCELDYSGQPAPRLPVINTFKERYDMWLLKRYGLPWLYWNVLLRGKKTPFLDERKTAEALRQESLATP
jgi:sulfide:quinone oxidoreductase